MLGIIRPLRRRLLVGKPPELFLSQGAKKIQGKRSKLGGGGGNSYLHMKKDSEAAVLG